MQMARKQRAAHWAEHQRRPDEAERRQRVMVVTEFDAGNPEATMHAMATEILRYRHCEQLADADRRESCKAMCETARTITEPVPARVPDRVIAEIRCRALALS